MEANSHMTYWVIWQISYDDIPDMRFGPFANEDDAHEWAAIKTNEIYQRDPWCGDRFLYRAVPDGHYADPGLPSSSEISALIRKLFS